MLDVLHTPEKDVTPSDKEERTSDRSDNFEVIEHQPSRPLLDLDDTEEDNTPDLNSETDEDIAQDSELVKDSETESGRPKRTKKEPTRYKDFVTAELECGSCKNYRDKVKFGGRGIKKQACSKRFN